MGVTASEFLKVAAGEIGYKERYDLKNDNWTNDNKYGIWYGMNKAAWCAQFVSWCAYMVGVLNILVPKYQSTFAGLKWFRDRDQTGYWPPKPGDIFMMCEYQPSKAGAWNDTTGTGWLTVHTGIVEKYLGDGKIQTIEGNTNTSGSAQGNGVYRLVRQDSPDGHRFIYARPKWDPELPVVGTGGDSIPVVTKPPAPAPTPVTVKPIQGSTYTGSKTIDVSQVRPGKSNEACRRFNGLMWAWLCKNSSAYARKHEAAWMKEPAALYGRESQLATQEMYRVLNSRYPSKFAKVTLPTWPGWNGVKAIGGTPV